MLLNDFVKLKENHVSETSNEDFKEILKVFLPIAQKILKLDKLPKIILKKHLTHLDQPTMGRFHNGTYTLELAIADRHPVDTLRTLAHELVHAKQESEHVDIDSSTGSEEENEANVLAGIIMREFNKLHPEYLSTTPISEGGNLAIGGKEAEQINLKVTNRSYIVPILNNLLGAINNAFSKQYKTPLWKPELLKSQKFLSGSSLHFFNVKGIPDEQFVAKKPKVGDIDTMVAKDAEANLDQFLTSVQGQQIGPATLIGYQRGNEQFSSLWELQDPPIKVQIDLEFVAFDKDEPTPWARFSHSSSWDDLQAGVKGVFHKFLIQSIPVLGRKDFLLRKMVGRGKARAEQDIPMTDNMVSFAVSSKEGGGLRSKYEPVLDDQGLPLIKDGLQVLQALPPEGYEKDIDQIFLTLFGDRIGPKQAAALSEKFWSFTGILEAMNQLLSPEEKAVVVDGFIKKLFDRAAQGLYRGDPDRDSAEKSAALDLMLKTLKVPAPADLEQMKADYKANYKVPTNESILREAPDYKRQGIKHIYNPGSSTEMKDLEFVEMCKEIAENGGTLDGMAVNLKADGAGIRFGKDQSGQPFFMTSKVTEPKYIDNYGDFERYATEMGQSPERIAFAKNYDEALKIILNSKFMNAIPADTIVQAEMMYNPMAQQTKDGLQFVNIPYDPAKLGKTMTLVPFMFKQFSTGETLPNAQEIKKNVLSASDANVKLVNNQLQQQGVDVSKIIDPVVNMDPDLLHALSSRTRVNPDKEAAREIISKARQELSDAIINSPAISGKDALGKNIEGLVVNLPSGRLAKVTSPMMKGAVAAKVAQKKQGKAKTAVVAIGSFVGHIGHEQLWNYTLQKAKQVGGDPYLFIGHAVGADDPIPPAVKVQTWQKLYPEYKNNISTVSVAGGSLMQKIKHELINPTPGQPPRYDNIIIMVGEDQAKMNIAQALMKAVNKFSGYEHVKVQLEVTPRGTGMSFTKLRNILKDPNATPEQQYQVWAQGFDEKKLGKDYILHLMDVARKGMGIQQPQPKVAERLFNSLMNIGASEAREPKPTVVVPGGDNPDAPHVPIKGDVPVVRGDIVMAQDPDNIASVFTGRVKRIGRTHVFIIKKNGEEIAVPHDQVSKDYDVLSRQAHRILNKKGKHIGNYKVDELQTGMAGVGMGNYIVDKNTSVEEDWKDVAKLAAIPAVAGAVAIGAQHVDDRQPHVDIGGKQVMVVDNPGWGTIPDNAMTLTGKDGKEYKVWKGSGKGTSQWLATPTGKGSKVTKVQDREYLLHSLPSDMSKVKQVTDDSGKQVYIWVEKAGMRPQYTYYWFAPADAVKESMCAKHISPSGAETTMCPDDDDYEINYGKDSGIDDFRKKNGLDVRTGKKVKDIDAQIAAWDQEMERRKKGVKENQLRELDVKSTLNFIKKAHGDQLYGDKPYFTHPKSVAATGKKFFGTKFNNDAIKVAFLHDVVEDTNFSIEQLATMGFTPEVVEAVGLLTKNKALSYADNIKAIINSGNRLAMMVKYADNYQNFTGDKSNFDPARADRLQKKYLASLNLLGAKLGINKHVSTPQAASIDQASSTDHPTDEAMLPKSAFAGSDKNKLGPAAHLKGSMKRPARAGDLVGGSAEESVDPCWKGYKQIGMKKKGSKQVPNCVPVGEGWETQIASLVEQLAKK